MSTQSPELAALIERWAAQENAYQLGLANLKQALWQRVYLDLARDADQHPTEAAIEVAIASRLGELLCELETEGDDFWRVFEQRAALVAEIETTGRDAAVKAQALGLDATPLLAFLRDPVLELVPAVLLLLDHLAIAQPAQPEARHSPDYRSVVWYGRAYAFTATQAAIVSLLWEAWAQGTPDVGVEHLLLAAGADTKRLTHLFRGHPARNVMIGPGVTKGTVRLVAPDCPRGAPGGAQAPA